MNAKSDYAPKVVLRMALPEAALARLVAAWPEAHFVTCADDEGLEVHLADVEVLIGGQQFTPQAAAAAPRLKLVQGLSVGVEGFLALIRARPDIAMANGRGINVIPLAEHALMLMLSFARGMPELSRRQAGHVWLHPMGPTIPKLFELHGARLGLVGYGQIGRTIAERAKAFGMEVWAMRRSSAAPEPGAADRVLGRDGFGELLASADHVMMMTPLTAETRGMMDAAAFARMKPTAYFYNMGRGGVADQAALIAALAEGRIAGAGLEVTDPEPLPPDSPLWSMENVIITGHTAGNTPRLLDRNVEFLVDQLGRYRRGEPLRNLVDGDAGY